uniref:Uncharacterized protein n=1 Tax=Haemonchus contortus TaxID=6289 RepID=A0A7I4Y008_HAECO
MGVGGTDKEGVYRQKWRVGEGTWTDRAAISNEGLHRQQCYHVKTDRKNGSADTRQQSCRQIDRRAQTDRQEQTWTERRQTDGRQKQTCSGQVDRWAMGQMHTGGRERAAHTGEYGQTDADRTGHGRTCSDGGGRARTKGRTRTDVDEHRQGRGMQKRGQTSYTDGQRPDTHLGGRSIPSIRSSSSHVLDHSRPCGSEPVKMKH